MAVFTNKVLPKTELFGVTMLGEAAAVTEIARRGNRLTSEQIAQVRTELDRLFPPMTTGPINVVPPAEPSDLDTSVPEPVRPADIHAPSVVDFSSLDNLTTQHDHGNCTLHRQGQEPEDRGDQAREVHGPH